MTECTEQTFVRSKLEILLADTTDRRSTKSLPCYASADLLITGLATIIM